MTTSFHSHVPKLISLHNVSGTESSIFFLARLVNNEIKDKIDLMKARKDIEHEMERFKLCEKEMKTKAFSKEGLGAAVKQDPREVKREEARAWLNEYKDKLEQQVSTHPDQL